MLLRECFRSGSPTFEAIGDWLAAFDDANFDPKVKKVGSIVPVTPPPRHRRDLHHSI